MKENKFGLIVKHWLKANPQFTCVFETKQTDKESISFREIKQAQLDWALAIRSQKGVTMRIQAVAEGMPDYAYFRNTPSWIVIRFPKGFVWISPDRFIAERDKSKKKSLTWSRAKDIATKTILLRKEKASF